jgi:hypothetical protein
MAIEVDATSADHSATATSLTFSHTCSGENRVLFVGVIGDTTTDTVTGVTYAGVAMTLVGKNKTTSNRYNYLYYLVAPATGANNVVISQSSSVFIGGASVSYTGVSPVDTIDASTTNLATATSITTSVTTVADNCWYIEVCGVGNSGLTVGAGTTERCIVYTAANKFSVMYDGNGVKTPAGSVSLIVNAVGSQSLGTVMCSFRPSVASTNTLTNYRPRKRTPGAVSV